MDQTTIQILKARRPEGVHNQHIKAAREHAVTDYPREAVGLLTPEGYIPCPNLAADPERDFEIDPAILLDHPTVYALVHSHPDGQMAPTATDMRSQIDMDVPWGILTCTAEDCADEPLWFGDGCPTPPLKGRIFVHGVMDCYSLIRDWYKVERGIALADCPRDDNWWEQGGNLYEQNFEQWGFKRIDPEADGLQEGDVFFSRFKSPVVNHAGIYVGGELILHHVSGHVSLTSPLNIWKRSIDYWVRYEGEG